MSGRLYQNPIVLPRRSRDGSSSYQAPQSTVTSRFYFLLYPQRKQDGWDNDFTLTGRLDQHAESGLTRISHELDRVV